MYLEYRSIADLNNVILRKLSIFPHDVDLIVGIPRSGMLPANLLALYLQKPFTDIDSFIEKRIYSSGERGKSFNAMEIRKVLVVDDSITTGKALRKSIAKLDCVSAEYEIKYAAIYATSDSKDKVDYYCEIINIARVFQWNIFNHPKIIPNSLFDIDGVLCEDPPIDDDGPLYLEYISHATPRFIPKIEIGALVSCRLEKYREVTEKWLNDNSVKYNKLIMLDFPSKEDRVRWGKHGEYKGMQYKESDAMLFFESSYSQAKIIASISKKPVFCTETFSMVICNQNYEKRKSLIKNWIRRNLLRVGIHL